MAIIRPAQHTTEHIPIEAHRDRRAPAILQQRAPTVQARATRPDAVAYHAPGLGPATSLDPSGSIVKIAQPPVSRRARTSHERKHTVPRYNFTYNTLCTSHNHCMYILIIYITYTISHISVYTLYCFH